MQLRKYRWSRDYESAEEELVRQLAVRNVQAERWHIEEHDKLEDRTYAFDSRLWCVEGSIMIHVAGKNISLQPGDTLDIPADTAHSATAGMTGAVCFQAHANTA